MTDLLKNLVSHDGSVKILFVGGCGEFGMNLTCYSYMGKLYLVDCGLAFSEEYELGVDAHVPDVSEIINLFGKVEAYFITHGHEDHLGALPFFLKFWPAPVYGTAWTLELLKDRLSRSHMNPNGFDLRLVRAGDVTSTGEVRVNWIHIPHSIPMCCSLWLEFGESNIYHTGDFKMDAAPPYENGPDWKRIQAAANSHIDILIADSTNAQKSGLCPSETTVTEPLEKMIRESQQLIVFTTFSSNFWRLRTIVDIAKRSGRKVHLSGAGIRKSFEIATELGFYEPDSDLFVESEAVKKYRRKDLIVIASGCQAEHRSALKRMIANEHPQITLQAGDRVIFSARVIPGNEKSVFKMISQCHEMGVEVVSPYEDSKIHVSGHAYSGDLMMLYDVIKPKHYIPVHGTFTQLTANKKLFPDGKAFAVKNGTLLHLKDGQLEKVADLDLSKKYIDSWSKRPMPYELLRGRLKVGDSGLLFISGWIKNTNSSLQFELDFESIGLPFHNDCELENWQQKARTRVEEISKQQPSHSFEEDDFNEVVRREIRRELTQIFIKKPVVFSKIKLIPQEHIR